MSERTKSALPKKRKRRGKPGRFLTAKERIIVCEILDTIEKYGMNSLMAIQARLIATKNKGLYGEQHAMFGGVVAGAKWGKANVERIRVLAERKSVSKHKQIER